MAVYTKISKEDISIINNNFNIEKILSFQGIKKGIENTNYLLKSKNKKYILTIFEKRVSEKEIPFFMELMDILNNYSGPNSEVCFNVKENFKDTLYEDGEIFLSTGAQTPSTNTLFFDSCVLVNKELNHRVLIKKNNLDGYNLFSCYLKDETFCSYELDK